MIYLEAFSENNLLPVNISKTKALLLHKVVAPKLSKIKCKSHPLEHVRSFKYLGVTITEKLGWGSYIDSKLNTIKNTYNALKKILYKIPKKEISIRRRIFWLTHYHISSG